MIELVHSGEDYFMRLRNIISEAQEEVHLQTYIFEDDLTGNEVAQALKKAVNRNVRVYVLLDGYGSAKLPNSFIEDLVRHGVNIRFFSPWHSKNNFYIGRRLHHKVVVADGKIALIGGINIANKYRGASSMHPWLDYAIQINSTSIAGSLQKLCSNIYLKKHKIKRKIVPSDLCDEKDTLVRIICNDWVKRRKEISNAYLSAFRNANNEIIILGNYFLPGRRLSRTMIRAAKRGVKVKLILSGVSDLPIVMRATQYLYPKFIHHKIEIFEWKKSVLHGKLAVVDKHWATVGSFNLNHLSSYVSIEMNAEIYSKLFSEKLHTHLIEVMKNCEIITTESFNTKNGIFTRITNWLSYCLVRLSLIIVTYISYKRILKI